MRRSSLRCVGLAVTTGVRWWFGLTYLATGVGGAVAIPIMIARGNEGWVYFLVGAPLIFVLGSVIIPGGLSVTRAALRRLEP